MLTPLILLIGFFDARKRLLHDIVVGTVIVNSAARAVVCAHAGSAVADLPFDAAELSGNLRAAARRPPLRLKG